MKWLVESFFEMFFYDYDVILVLVVVGEVVFFGIYIGDLIFCMFWILVGLFCVIILLLVGEMGLLIGV